MVGDFFVLKFMVNNAKTLRIFKKSNHSFYFHTMKIKTIKITKNE